MVNAVQCAQQIQAQFKAQNVVLPFANMSKDPEQDYFSDSITEDITEDLSKISSLFVIVRNSTFSYKGKSPIVQDMSREMGVWYVSESVFVGCVLEGATLK